MEIRILGAHNTESQNTRYTCLLVDDILAIDAGGLTSSLSFQEQLKIKGVFITHGHYDHIKDIPALAMNFYLRQKDTVLYTHQTVIDILTQHLLNGTIYPSFHQKPSDNPTLKIKAVEQFREINFEGYKILPVPVTHAVPAMGYQVTSSTGQSVFYTGDTGPGLSEIWRHISPQILFIELTASDRFEDAMRNNGHLTPRLLHQELSYFREIKKYLPQIFAVHINPAGEKEIFAEIASVEHALGVSIHPAYEGMRIQL